MRAKELNSNSGSDIQKLADAIDGWIESHTSISAVRLILAHPLAKQFRTCNSKDIYRSMYYRGNEAKSVLKKNARFPIISYSESSKLSIWAVEDYERPLDIVCYKKMLKPSSVILNFSAFASYVLKKYKLPVYSDRNEREIWIKASPYYLTFNPSEIIYDSGNHES